MVQHGRQCGRRRGVSRNSPHRNVRVLPNTAPVSTFLMVTVFINGLPYCQARLAGTSTGSTWILEISKPMLLGCVQSDIQIGEADTRLPVELIKPSTAVCDLRIIVGLPHY